LAVIGLLVLYRAWRCDASPWQFLGFVAVVIVVGGWRYFQHPVGTGMLFAMGQGFELKGKGGLLAGLAQHFGKLWESAI
jgi:hypothetical protein